MDDLMKESPVFHQMKLELSVVLTIVFVIVAILLFKLL